LLKQIASLISYNALGYFFLFISSIVIFRNVDKSIFGFYVFLMSIFAISDLMQTGLNESLVRFLKDRNEAIKKEDLFFSISFIKLTISLISIVAVFFLFSIDFFHEFMELNFARETILSYIIIGSFSHLIGLLVGLKSSLLNAYKLYQFTAKIAVFKYFFYLICVVILSFFSNVYLHYLFLNLVISFLVFIVFCVKILDLQIEIYSLKTIKSIKLFRDKKLNRILKNYSFPLQFSSLMSYSKNHLPVIILARVTDLESVAYFSIIKLFFKNMHSVLISFYSPMISKFNELKQENRSYKNSLNKILYSSFAVRLIIFLFAFHFSNYFFLIYKIPQENNSIYFVYIILGLEFLISAIIINLNIPLRLEKSSFKLLYVNISRFILEILLIVIFLADYGVLGAAYILFFSRFFETIVAYFFNIKNGIFTLSISLVLLVFLIFYILVFIN